MTFYVTVITLLMALLRNKFTNIVIPTYFSSSTFGIFGILIFCDKILSQLIETWMKDHLVSDNVYSIANLKCPNCCYTENQTMLGLYLVLQLVLCKTNKTRWH